MTTKPTLSTEPVSIDCAKCSLDLCIVEVTQCAQDL